MDGEGINRTRLLSSPSDPRVAYGYETGQGRTVAVLRLGGVPTERAVAETLAAAGSLDWASFRYVALSEDVPAGVLSEVLRVAERVGLGVLVGRTVRRSPEERPTDWYSVSLLAPVEPPLASVLAERASLFGRPATPGPAALPLQPRPESCPPGMPEGYLPPGTPQPVSLAEMMASEPPALPAGHPAARPPAAVVSRDGRHHAVLKEGDGYLLRTAEGTSPVSLAELSAFAAAGELSLVGEDGDELESAMESLSAAETAVPALADAEAAPCAAPPEAEVPFGAETDGDLDEDFLWLEEAAPHPGDAGGPVVE